MAWTSPRTWVANAVLTAAQLNTDLRDNMNETAAAKATTSGSLFVASGLNSLVERTPVHAEDFNNETTTSTTFTDLTTVGPAVTATTGSKALVIWTADLFNNTVNASTRMSFAVSGATTIAADENHSIHYKTSSGSGVFDFRAAGFRMLTTLTPGSNTFTCKYRVTSGTGTFNERYIFVLPL